MRVLIIGAGNAGRQLAERLCEEKHSIVMVDTTADALAEAEARLDIMTVCGPGSSPQTLEAAQVEKCQLVIAVTDCDEVNILACLYANAAGVERKVARVSSPHYIHGAEAYSLERMGIDLVINQKQECAREIFNVVQMPGAIEAFDLFHGKVMVAGFRAEAGSPILGHTPVSCPKQDLIEKIRIIAVRRSEKLLIPHGETVFEEGDAIYLVGARKDIAAFFAWVCPEYKPFSKVIVAGGGDLGLMLTKMLEKADIESVLLEQDEERARYCSGELHKTLVLKLDALAESALEETGIVERTAFVALTGDDENNIMNCLMAQKKGAAFTVTQIRRTDYAPIVETLKLIDRIISPYISMTHGILHYLRSRHVQAASLLHNLPGELLDIVITEKSAAAGKTIQAVNVKMPKASIIATVLRGREVLPAVGTLELAAKDRLLIFAHPDAVKKLRAMFLK